MEKEQVLYDSPEAAQLKTNLSSWLSRDGRLFGENEHLACYCGATHINCEDCGEVRRINTNCEPCWEKKQKEKFDLMPFEKWDGEAPVAIFVTDTYFFDLGYFLHYCDVHELKPEEIDLVFCEPNYANQIDADYWCDDIFEGGELPAEMAEALDKSNEIIGRNKTILSWSPGNKRAIY